MRRKTKIDQVNTDQGPHCHMTGTRSVVFGILLGEFSMLAVARKRVRN